MERTIQLSKTYQVGSIEFDAIRIKEPTYFDVYVTGLGKPFETIGNSQFRVVIPEAIAAYAGQLVTSPPADCLREISAADAMRLEEAIFDFFTVPAVKPASQENGSSSEQASMQPSSAE